MEEKTEQFDRKTFIVQLGIFIAMIVAIVLLFFTITTLIKDRDIIKSDPLIYGMRVHNFSSCNCVDKEGFMWESTETGFKHQRRIDDRLRYTNFTIDFGYMPEKNGTD